MKLTCNLQIVTRQVLAGRNITSCGKSQRSVLSIGKKSSASNEIFLLVQTRSSSSCTKYRMKDNVESIFTKFVKEGKSTIRLKEPTIDLNIKCDTIIELKTFLHVLKLVLEAKLHPSILPISNLAPKKISPPAKKVVSVKSEADYPILEGFPRTVEILHISGLNRKSFDRQILRLQSLTQLNISNNLISSLPKDIGTLPHLKSLDLSQNKLGTSQNVNAWSWLNHPNIQNNLEVLNLSSNQLKYVPKQIGRLLKLSLLSLNDNELTLLPFSIGKIKTLKSLNVTNNLLTSLPGSMLKMRLDVLSIAGNFQSPPPEIKRREINILTLVELAGRVVVNERLNYHPTEIPFTLCEYLDNAKFCRCGKSCIDACIYEMCSYNPKECTYVIVAEKNLGYPVPYILTFCSQKCINSYK